MQASLGTSVLLAPFDCKWSLYSFNIDKIFSRNVHNVAGKSFNEPKSNEKRIYIFIYISIYRPIVEQLRK